jgi:conjugal transfer pilus assembly protein TraW
MRRSICLVVVLMLAGAVPGWSKDFGQQGAVFPVIEADLLAVIEARLRNAEAGGKIAAMNRQLATRTTAAVKRPPPVLGISAATETRSWTYDPTITVEQDIRDHQGNLIIAAGRRINPLASVGLRQSLVFLDGDNPAQLAAKFGIQHVPAVVEQDGALLKITEVVVAPLPRAKAGR